VSESEAIADQVVASQHYPILDQTAASELRLLPLKYFVARDAVKANFEYTVEAGIAYFDLNKLLQPTTQEFTPLNFCY